MTPRWVRSTVTLGKVTPLLCPATVFSSTFLLRWYPIIRTHNTSVSSSSYLYFFYFFFLMIRHPPRSPLFPYTPLFRSLEAGRPGPREPLRQPRPAGRVEPGRPRLPRPGRGSPAPIAAMDRPRVLVVEDDGDLRDLLVETLTRWGCHVTSAGNGTEALTLLEGRLFDVALLDIWLPGHVGLPLLEEIKRHDSTLEVVMMTGDPLVSTAVQALKAGAYDYLIKPLNLEQLQPPMRQLIERRFLRQEVGSLRARLGRELAERELVGTSPQMLEVKQTIASVANSDSPVRIEGERGTGK